jgi:poly-beta-1,6-N-acetyl-D-glucosamine biosynthesis protein PgaD
MGEIEVFDNPKLKSFWRHLTEGGITTLMWAGWIYLFLPLMNLILWFLGVRIFYVEVVQRTGYQEFLAMMARLGWAVVIIFIVLRVWGYYNLFRFGRKTRRIHIPSLRMEERLPGFFQISRERAAILQNSKESVWPWEEDPLADVRKWLEERKPPGLTERT